MIDRHNKIVVTKKLIKFLEIFTKRTITTTVTIRYYLI